LLSCGVRSMEKGLGESEQVRGSQERFGGDRVPSAPITKGHFVLRDTGVNDRQAQ
jgi:hypothetical protein